MAAGADAVMGWLGLGLGYCSRRFSGWVSMHGAVGVRGGVPYLEMGERLRIVNMFAP